MTELRRRLQERVDAWNVVVERRIDTETSILLFGRTGAQPVVLKVARHPGVEWASGAVLEAFGGLGVVRVLGHVEGAVLLEQLRPGDSLATLTLEGNDDQAMGILAQIIGRMAPGELRGGAPTIEEWGHGFQSYAAGGDRQIPASLVASAQRVYSRLCASQRRPRLLHGDLHHDNVLRDSERGWLAIDPKGVLGELEYEVGAAFRNPIGRPDLFTPPATIRRRADRLAHDLHMDTQRILGWAYAQAVLAVVWMVEDGLPVQADNAWLVLAQNIRPMLI